MHVLSQSLPNVFSSYKSTCCNISKFDIIFVEFSFSNKLNQIWHEITLSCVQAYLLAQKKTYRHVQHADFKFDIIFVEFSFHTI
jgi:hypothetical protein